MFAVAVASELLRAALVAAVVADVTPDGIPDPTFVALPTASR
jgi:hypothetical protein